MPLEPLQQMLLGESLSLSLCMYTFIPGATLIILYSVFAVLEQILNIVKVTSQGLT